MTYSIIIQLIVSGLALGFIYALVAIEYTLIFNSTGHYAGCLYLCSSIPYEDGN